MLLLLVSGFLIRARVGQGWTFRGADSFAYMGAASELYENHRYAFRLPAWYPAAERNKPLTLGYGRQPAYSALLAAVMHTRGASYEDYGLRIKRVQWWLDIGTCALVFLIARRLAGRLTALLALGLAVASPFLCLYANSILTETLATFLSTLTLFLWLAALQKKDDSRRRLWLWGLGGVVAGLAALTRIDSLALLMAALGPLIFLRGQRSGALLALALFALVYAPWPIRNAVRLGHPYVLGGQCDISGKEMAHTGFFPWFATWIVDGDQTPTTLYCMFIPRCQSSIGNFPEDAFDGFAERDEALRLMTLRNREGHTAQTDAGFIALAKRRLRAHPFRTLVVLPLRRAYHQWTSRNDEPLRATSPHWPWLSVTKHIEPRLGAIAKACFFLGAIGLLILLLRSGISRHFALLLGLALLSRSAALALIGFVEARYLLELHPICIVLASVAIAAPFTLAVRALRPRVR